MAAAATEPPAGRHPSAHPGVDRTSGGVLLATFGAAGLGWLVALALGRELAQRGTVWLSVTAAAAALVAAGALWRRTPARLSLCVLVFLGVLGAVLPYERALGTSVWAWNGLTGDQSFRTEYLTRFADSPALADYTYADLPAVYPPAWFWVVGQVAHLSGVPAWQLMRPATTATVVLVVGIGTLLTRPALGTRAAALGVGLAATYGTATLWEPYLLLAGFVVLSCIVRLPDALDRGATPRSVAGLAAGFAAVFLCYTHGAAILAVSCLAVAALRRPRGARLLVVAVSGAAALAATWWYWVPAWVAVGADRADGVPAQLTWLSAENTALPWHLLSHASPTPAVALGGLGWLVLWGRRTRWGASVLVFLGVAFLWCCVSVLLSRVAAIQLQPNRVGEVMVLVATACSGPAAADVRTWLGAARLGPSSRVRAGKQGRAGRSMAAGLAGTLAALVVLWTSSWWAAQRDLPGAVTARSTGPPTDARRLAAAVEQAVRLPADRIVVLTGRSDLLATSPMRGFQQWNETYAHPAADFRARSAYLRRAFGLSTGRELANRLRHTPWGPVHALVLPRDGDGYRWSGVQQDRSGHDKRVSIRLPGSLVSGRAFRVVDTGSDPVIVPR